MDQMTKGITKKMRQVLIERGHIEGRNFRMLAKFYVFSTVILISNTIFDIYNLEAHQFEEKIFRFKNINMLICGLAYPFVDRNTYRLISYVEDGSLYTFISETSRTKFLQEKLNIELKKVNQITYVVAVFIMGTLTIAPLIATIFKIYLQISSGESIKVSGLALPIIFWYPEEYSNIYTYFLLYALEIFYIYLFTGYLYVVLVSGVLALKITISDLKFLCLTVEGWKEFDGQNPKFWAETFSRDALTLKASIVNVIKFHDFICRRISYMSRELEIIYTIFNNTICFQICVCLYSSAKMDDLVLKIENVLLVIPLAGILLLYCLYAQKLLNEGEKFRTILWDSSFEDKPNWYRKLMLTIMIRNTKDLEIKAFGFYSLNLRTFSLVMKAAYSYFNMLNSLKKII